MIKYILAACSKQHDTRLRMLGYDPDRLRQQYNVVLENCGPVDSELFAQMTRLHPLSVNYIYIDKHNYHGIHVYKSQRTNRLRIKWVTFVKDIKNGIHFNQTTETCVEEVFHLMGAQVFMRLTTEEQCCFVPEVYPKKHKWTDILRECSILDLVMK